MKKECIVCDLDGTLAINNSGRSFYDEMKCYRDDVNVNLCQIIAALMFGLLEFGRDVDFILVSGRKEKSRGETERWLRDKAMIGDCPFTLYMRKDDDNRDDTIVKEEIYNEYIKDQYGVIAWFDDRNKVVKHMRSLGLPVFQVADGDF